MQTTVPDYDKINELLQSGEPGAGEVLRDLLLEAEIGVDDDIEVRRRALAVHLGENLEDLDDLSYSPCYGEGSGFEGPGHREYAVMTDEEADQAWEASLDSYLEDVVYPELQGSLATYFDDEAWKRDARHDGRAHSIGTYDGSEDFESDPVTGAGFVVVRMN